MEQDQRPSTASSPASAPQGEQSFYTPSSEPAYVEASPNAASAQPLAADRDVISWQASEYVHNDKGSLWLVSLIIALVIAVGAALYFQQWSFAAIILVMGIAFGVFAFRLPHTLSYKLDAEGIEIGDQFYPYSNFRAFGILEDGAFFTMTLIPVKRFSPALSVYFAEADGERIVDMIGDHLPMEHVEPDLIDNLMRRLRF